MHDAVDSSNGTVMYFLRLRVLGQVLARFLFCIPHIWAKAEFLSTCSVCESDNYCQSLFEHCHTAMTYLKDFASAGCVNKALHACDAVICEDAGTFICCFFHADMDGGGTFQTRAIS